MNVHISARAILLGLWVSLMGGVLAGCESMPPSLRNAGPAVLVVAVRPDPGQAATLMAVDLYIRDLERDPVDIKLSVWRASGEREEGVVPTTPGHGTRGLNADPREPGAWHRLYLDLSEVPGNEEVFVEIESVDSRGNPGMTTATDPFKPEDGWVVTAALQGSP